jgi:galacturan 1,4-alpha-galacturonidase
MRLAVFLKVLAASLTLVSANPGGIAPARPTSNGKICTVKACGNRTDDTPQILKAFKDCNNGGTVIFPADQNFWIGTKLNPVIRDVTIKWGGTWTVCHYLVLVFWPSKTGVLD